MTDEELQALLDSGDPTNIDKALAYLDENKEDVLAESSSGNSNAQTGAAESKLNGVTPDSPSDDDAAPSGVQSKNGGHVLPYEVLEQARQDAKEARRQLALLQEQQANAPSVSAEIEALREQAELMKTQLEKAGIKPAQLDADLVLTEEELDALDEYGDVGAVSKKSAKKIHALEAQVKALIEQTKPSNIAPAPSNTQQPVNDVTRAIASVDGLTEVMNHPELSQKAIAIDEQLKLDAKWSNKPMEARFLEVMRRMTPVILKQDTDKAAGKPFDPDHVAPPHSLSGISNHINDTSDGLESIFNGLSEEQVQAKYMTLSPAQQEQVNRMLGW